MKMGWIKLHRKLQDNPLWTSEPFSKGQAWVDLILIANHADNFFYKRGNKVNVKRGQVGFSEVGLSDRWQWSRTKVRKFLNDLEKEQQIIQQKTNVTQIITIVNYNEYQEKEQQSGQQKNSRRTAEEQQKDTNKNVKNNKNVKKDNREVVFPFDSENFKNWWSIWKEYKKKEHNFKYASTISEQAALKKLTELSSGDEEIALKIIEQSISEGWKGFFELKKSGKLLNKDTYENLKRRFEQESGT